MTCIRFEGSHQIGDLSGESAPLSTRSASGKIPGASSAPEWVSFRIEGKTGNGFHLFVRPLAMSESEAIIPAMSSGEKTNRKMSNQKTPVLRWIVLAVVVVGGLWLGIRTLQNAKPAGAGQGGGQAAPAGPPPATVILAPVKKEPVQEKRRVTGTLRAVNRAEIAAQESGAIVSVAVDVGDLVEEGDEIARLDERRLRASLEEAKSMLTATASVVSEREAEASRASRDLEMKESLFQQRAVSEKEFLDSQRESSVAAAKLQAAKDESEATKSALDLLEVRLEDLGVKAPFSGRIVQRHVDPGEWIAPGEPVVTMVSAGTIEAWMNVPERFVGLVSNEEAGFSIVADGSGVAVEAGRIRSVSDIDPVTRLFPVVVELDDQGGGLVPGQSVHAELPVGKSEEMLGVPIDAVIETYQGASVFKAAPSPEGGMPIAERVSVAVKFRRDGIAYIDSEVLRAGEQVVVEGNERLFPGTPLVVGNKDATVGASEVKP